MQYCHFPVSAVVSSFLLEKSKLGTPSFFVVLIVSWCDVTFSLIIELVYELWNNKTVSYFIHHVILPYENVFWSEGCPPNYFMNVKASNLFRPSATSASSVTISVFTFLNDPVDFIFFLAACFFLMFIFINFEKYPFYLHFDEYSYHF